MFKCLFSKNEDDIQTFLEGYDILQGEWKSVDGEIKYKRIVKNVQTSKVVKNGSYICIIF